MTGEAETLSREAAMSELKARARTLVKRGEGFAWAHDALMQYAAGRPELTAVLAEVGAAQLVAAACGTLGAEHARG